MKITYCLLFAIFLAGCATVSTRPPLPIKDASGVYHRVKKGQTLWRIAKAYNIDLEKIARINRLADTSRIYTGQLIFIPDAQQAMDQLILETDFKDRAGDFIWPVKGKVISFFGMKKDNVKNKGIYIQTKKGTDIYATRSGKIAFCSEQFKSYGKIVIIDHLDGYSTVYAQNSKNSVKLNQLVRRGEVIAQTGLSNRSVSPELYFEIRKGHKPQNPFFYLP
ncbi:murein hydrolase activator EnvC family protein [Candidatus Omnitrophota bacterium]